MTARAKLKPVVREAPDHDKRYGDGAWVVVWQGRVHVFRKSSLNDTSVPMRAQAFARRYCK